MGLFCFIITTNNNCNITIICSTNKTDNNCNIRVKSYTPYPPFFFFLGVGDARNAGVHAQDEASACICQNFTCQAPTNDPEVVRNLLKQPPAAFKPPTGTATPLKVDLGSLNTGASVPRRP